MISFEMDNGEPTKLCLFITKVFKLPIMKTLILINNDQFFAKIFQDQILKNEILFHFVRDLHHSILKFTFEHIFFDEMFPNLFSL